MDTTTPIPARPATAGDLPAVAATLAAAFHEDPVFRWWIPDATRRGEILPGFFAAIAGAHLDAGRVDATEDAGSCAVWAPPGAEDDDALVGELAAVAGEYAGAAFEILERTAAVHPADEHWYLFFLGTRPDRQSRGLGSAAMRPVLGACDAAGMPAYLEATSERGARLYERHGFEVVGEIALPGGPSLWPMWREAR